jgi:5-enolpyruvylshikimate-3-phosphate synthase
MIILPKSLDVQCQLNLAGSKSESNRALMISAYGGFRERFLNISDSDDTRLLYNLLSMIAVANRKEVNTIDCENAGTVYRFLLSYLAGQEGLWILTGSDRMLSRPIGPLVDTLRILGAQIEYKGNVGYPPLFVHGGKIHGGNVSVNTDQSSQFASSLMLAAPTWTKGLTLSLIGELKSLPYIDLSIAMMSHFGAQVKRNSTVVTVEPTGYEAVETEITTDWSSASYWYELAAFSSNCNIFIRKIKYPSWQGDSNIVSIAEQFGVYSISNLFGLAIQKVQSNVKEIQYDFSNTPDLFPTVAAMCAGLGVAAVFTGLSALSVKESDRLAVMSTELSKIGVQFNRLSDDVMELVPASKLPYFSKNEPVIFDSHKDHRVAMSLSVLAMKIGAVKLLYPEAVSKSYPLFFSDLDNSGAFVLI